MKITKITLTEYKPFIQNKSRNDTPEKTHISNPVTESYRDFNINFKGRTPENFYEQEFNIKYMPDTMKKFLNADYEERKHVPPEQIMSESFKFLTIADSLEDVKSIYPEEPLFANLHEADLKGRSGILSDIKLAGEMSDTPLLNDGSDNFGIYLLRKIYLEGKTIKEINKDFYEKDLNPEYKGIISQPITYGTTSAYGIRYPKTDFWHSFIATRDEYKKFFVNLPKQSKSELQKELTAKQHPELSDKPEKVESTPRKYTIKKYQKDRIKKDIIKSKGDEKSVKDAISGRFTKDDPEAAFIVKYFSPIMTIAADRIHLSEEMKEFADSIKSENYQAEALFAKFWKARPEMLNQYSTAITDTIDLFEETYGGGGLIPINNEFKIITKDSENQKAIDFVPQRFIELLGYAQSIVPKREQAYAGHDEEQAKWDEHFLWRYGEVKPEETTLEKPVKTAQTLEVIKDIANQNNAKVYTLKGTNGDKLHITANLDETLGDYIRRQYFGYPPKFLNLLIRKAINNPLMTEQAKLSFSTVQISDKIQDETILGEAQRNNIMKILTSDIYYELITATAATIDTLALRSETPWKIYRTILFNTREGDVDEYRAMIQKTQNESQINDELNNLYDYYKKPLSDSEIIKITLMVMDYIRHFDIKSASLENSVLIDNKNILNGLLSFREQCKYDKNFQQVLKREIAENVSKLYFGRGLLRKSGSSAKIKSQTEAYITLLLGNLFETAQKLGKI